MTDTLNQESINQTLDRFFTYHPPKDANQIARYTQIRDKAKRLAIVIAETVPDCEERSIAINKIREVVMWANAGIACNK